MEKNIRFEAMKPVFTKKKKVFIHANRVQEITDAIYFFDDYEFEIVLVGAYDAWLLADLLKDRSIPVVLRRVHSLPMNQDDDVDLPYKMPKILADKGILVSLDNIQMHLENPFDQVGEDDVEFNVEKFIASLK